MAEPSPEVQAQLAEQKKNCPFCKIIAGEIDSKKVYEDELIVGVLDINPWVKGHVLLMPKEHYPIMPFIPPETFKHMFGTMPKLIEGLKKGAVATGVNIFVANGGVAGQQSPHFLIHLIPRDGSDGHYKYMFENGQVDEEKLINAINLLKQNIPIMIENHKKREPARWHDDNFTRAEHLKEKDEVLYEDQKVLVCSPKNPVVPGHIVIYSQDEPSLIENLDELSCSHFFYVASYCATAVFEGLGAQGSNIILKSGDCSDNLSGSLEIHVLPRGHEDGVDVLIGPMANKPDLDDVAKALKDSMFIIKLEENIEYRPVPREKNEIWDAIDNIIND